MADKNTEIIFPEVPTGGAFAEAKRYLEKVLDTSLEDARGKDVCISWDLGKFGPGVFDGLTSEPSGAVRAVVHGPGQDGSILIPWSQIVGAW